MMKFYVYAYMREDGTPYYIGKGTGDRAYRQHRRGEVMYDPPSKDRIKILKNDMSEFDAYVCENEMILKYGRKDIETGILINMSDGGEGTSGRPCSDVCKERTRETNTGKVHTEETRRKVSEAVKGRRWWNDGERDKHCKESPGEEWVLGRLHKSIQTTESRAKTRAANVGTKHSPETRAKMRAARKGRQWWWKGDKTLFMVASPGEGWERGRPRHLQGVV